MTKNYGYRIPHSEITKERIRRAMIGREITWADKISKTLTGHVRTAESRAKQSAATKGVPKTIEHREAISAAIGTAPPSGDTSQERARLAKNAKRAARRAAGLPRLY